MHHWVAAIVLLLLPCYCLIIVVIALLLPYYPNVVYNSFPLVTNPFVSSNSLSINIS